MIELFSAVARTIATYFLCGGGGAVGVCDGGDGVGVVVVVVMMLLGVVGYPTTWWGCGVC